LERCPIIGQGSPKYATPASSPKPNQGSSTFCFRAPRCTTSTNRGYRGTTNNFVARYQFQSLAIIDSTCENRCRLSFIRASSTRGRAQQLASSKRYIFYFPDLRVRIMRQFIREVTIGQHVHSAEQCLLLTATKNNGGTSTSDVYCGVTRTAF
jgi:hypothetical protein